MIYPPYHVYKSSIIMSYYAIDNHLFQPPPRKCGCSLHEEAVHASIGLLNIDQRKVAKAIVDFMRENGYIKSCKFVCEMCVEKVKALMPPEPKKNEIRHTCSSKKTTKRSNIS
jgi:hypothetical protein